MDLKELFMLLNLAAFVGTWVWQGIRSRTVASEADVAQLKQELAALKSEVRAMPNSELVHEMSASLRGVQQALQGMGQRVDGMQRSVDRVTDYLLDNKG